METKPLEVLKAEEGMQFELGQQFRCAGCGKIALLNGWVAAHWHEEIVHNCQECGTRTGLLEGEVTYVDIPETPAQEVG